MEKRYLLIIFAVILALGSVFSSCGKQNTTIETEESGVNTGIPFIENGESQYTIVFPDTMSPNLMSAVTTLKNQLRTLTGVKLESLSESSVRTEGDTGRMILVGQTSFRQSTEALEKLSGTCSDEYVITSEKGIIVINSHFETSLKEAARVFLEEAISFDANTGVMTVKDVFFNGTVELPVEFDVDSVGVYSIVYANEPVGLEAIANSIRDEIKTATGKTLPVYRDTAMAETVHEILVGPTNRPFSNECYAESSHIMQYEMRVANGKLQLVFGGPYSGKKCVEKFKVRILALKDKLVAGTSYYATDFATDSQALTTGADIRVMSSNVLAYQWGEKSYSNVYPVSTRCEIYAGVLLRFQPDIVGVQETDEPWMKALPYYLEAMAAKDNVEYTHLLRRVTLNGTTVVNFTSILYRSDLYTVNDSGCEIFEANYQTTYCQRVGTWAKFTAKSDSTRQMILVNTHWAHETVERILSCVNEEAALIDRLKTQYPNVPIFCTGDFNSDPAKKPRDEDQNDPNVLTRDQYLKQFVQQISGAIASDLAKEKGVLITPGGCRASASQMNEATLRAVDDNFIDHIIITGGYADVLRHDTIRSNGCHVMTDHSPIYADFSLKQTS